MRYKLKKIITYLLLIILIVAQVPNTSLADGDIGGDGNKGGGEHTSGGASGNYTWHEDQSGYRITIVDRNLKPVSNTVDLLFSDPIQKFGSNRYTNPRTSLGLSTSQSNWEYITFDTLIKKKVIDVKPPHPISRERNSSGKLVAYGRGSEFKGWFLAGEKFITSPYSPPPVFTPTSPSTSNTSRPSSNKKPSSQTNVSKGSSSGGGGGSSPKTKEMALPSFESLRTSPYVRSTQLRTAMDYVIAEGNATHAINLISKAESHFNSRMQTWLMVHNGDVNTAMKKALKETWSYLGREAKSNASRVYAMIAIFNRKGTGTGGYAYNNRSTNDGLIYAQSEELLELGEIPLSNKKQEGYGKKILNYKANGKYLFKLKGVDMSKYSGVVDAIAQLGYDIIVEPIFWFVPTGYNATTKTAQNYHSNYIYGSISNIIKFHVDNPKYGASGGFHSMLVGRVGWRSMYTIDNWPEEGATKIKKYNTVTADSVTAKTTWNKISNQEGIGIHVYTSVNRENESDSQQTTRDKAKGKNPHPAPDPSGLLQPKDDTKQYKIIKYYEYEKDGEFIRTKHVRNNNPPSIKIENEPDYLVQEWFINNNSSDGKSTYAESKRDGYTRVGILTETVKMKKGSEKTLHVLLVKKEGEGDLTLRQSEISKTITTMSSEIPNWGPRKFSFKVPEITGTSGSLKFFYNIVNIATVDKKVEAIYGDLFKPQMINSAMEGEAPLEGFVAEIPDAEYRTAIWRGYDIPTIAKYKEPDNAALKPIKGLLGRYGNTPAGDRHGNGSYTKNLNIQLGLSKDSITKTRGANHQYNTVAPHKGTVTVNVFRGGSKPKGDVTQGGPRNATRNIGKARYKSTGYMIQNDTPIKFYPYVRMSYQTVNQADKSDVYVLSTQESEILPNDYVEIASYNSNMEESLKLASTQWSVHQRAVNGGKSWNGHNQVLPGGAIYFLTTGDERTEVSVTTWQTVVDTGERNALSESLPSGKYTVDEARNEHNRLADDVEESLGKLRIVQWVNADPNASTAWVNNGKAVKVTGGGVDLRPLGLNGKTSDDAKYHLRSDIESANRSNLDVLGKSNLEDIYYKLFADTFGNIYLATDYGSISALRNINGDNLRDSGEVHIEKILSKTDTGSNIESKLTSDVAKELEQKTKAITNFARVLERNKGSDTTASWASDGKWYNEAWDGIYVIRKTTSFSIGLGKPKTRAAALDPRLCPKSTGKRDMFSKAFLSQFTVEAPSTNVGTFKGKPIAFDGIQDVFRSRKMYIPNVNVQDLDS